jgi:hypothetical protein
MFLMICDADLRVLIARNSQWEKSGLPFRAKVTNEVRQIHFVSDPFCAGASTSCLGGDALG